MAERNSRISGSTTGTVTINKKHSRTSSFKHPLHIPTQTTGLAGTIPSPGALLGSPRKEQVEVSGDTKQDGMTACFLQYCATCENLITHPSPSILYCSESCRRKDSAKPLSAAILNSTTSAQSLTNMSSTTTTSPPTTPSSPRPILQARTPTGYNPPTITTPPNNHNFKPDLDPTEWKPAGRSGRERPVSSRYSSEAFRYLSQFHRSISKTDIHGTMRTEDQPGETSFDVPANLAIASTAPTPSLANTPATTSSSWSIPTPAYSSSSSVSISNTYTAGGYTGLEKNGYNFNTRPLPPRHSRWSSLGVNGGGGVDLVTPHVAPTYTKNEVSLGGGKSALGAFFGGSVDDN